MKRILLIASLLFVFSCTKDNIKIDGRDQVVFNETIDQIAKELPLLQQDKFKEALDIVFHYKTSVTNNDEQRWAAVRNLVDNKTADEVFELAEKIAVENNFSWNRNQVPLVNGIPLPGTTTVNEVIEVSDEPAIKIQRFDFRVKTEDEGIRVDPFFFDVEGQEIQLEKAVTATLEVFSGNQIIYTQRTKIDPNSMDALYRNNGILLKYSSLDQSKIKSNTIDILIRIPHPERYLTQRKTVSIPTDLVGGAVEAKVDSVSKVISKDIAMVTTLSNRFMQNVSKKNYSAAFALTRNSDWATYQKFSQDNFVSNLENAKVKETKVVDGDEKIVIIESNVVLNDDSNKKYILTLEHLNGKWFIVNVK
ncbi:hypothetical protein [Faecalibacter macacae]|uniref:Uncharacterized protein n=1 Tax=Faecalibacter macacae TaxID=1859289 RepID=A0A3L9M1L7_9FLAO|nr:hypothetical protein [Faecalibacter macacae]RLZ06895.1 hypothetical protein EAH69_12470 [Faecalibacter macacae]